MLEEDERPTAAAPDGWLSHAEQPPTTLAIRMVGRTDDWIKVAAERQRLSLDPGYYEWAGVAVFKNA